MRVDKDLIVGYERRGKKDLGGLDDDEDGDFIGGDFDFFEDNDVDCIGVVMGILGFIEMMFG